MPSYPGVSEYSVNISNQSIGRVASVNNLYGIETRYVPYEFIKGISLENPKSESLNSKQIQNPNNKIQNNLQIDKVIHKYPHRYDVAISNKQSALSQTRLLVLNQSFDKGWGIYEKDSCFLSIVSPITCSKAQAEHVLAKNWANGWLLSHRESKSEFLNPKSETITNDQNSNVSKFLSFGNWNLFSNLKLEISASNSQELVILFWPQWLQYTGYIFLLAWFFGLTIFYFIKKSK